MNQHYWYTGIERKLRLYADENDFQSLWNEIKTILKNHRFQIFIREYDGSEESTSSSGMLFQTQKPYTHLNIMHKQDSKVLQINLKGISELIKDSGLEVCKGVNILIEILLMLFMKDGEDAYNAHVSVIKELLNYTTRDDKNFMDLFKSWILRGWLWHHENEVLPLEWQKDDPNFDTLFSRVITAIYACGTGMSEVRAECILVLKKFRESDIRFIHHPTLINIANASCWYGYPEEKEKAFDGWHEHFWEEYIPEITQPYQIQKYDAIIRSGILPARTIDESHEFWTENLAIMLSEGNLHLAKALVITIGNFLEEKEVINTKKYWWIKDIVSLAFEKAFEAKRYGVAIALNNEFKLESKIDTDDHRAKVRKCHEMIQKIEGTIGFSDAERFI